MSFESVRRVLCSALVVIAFVATTAPLAHVLELPNKLSLDGPSWLLVQQRLYAGWGAVFGPLDLAAIVVGVALCLAFRRDRPVLRDLAGTVAIYVLMIVVFFAFNAPVNTAFNGWTVGTMPGDWPRYRVQWELGHAMAALLSLIGLALAVRARFMISSTNRVAMR